ncbi:uncharacterized protein LOC128641196 [Bombina bombina]|uniref:uncharacterized protein LOC128641196 n=1 Tax=Bombina bombina TaxID=8345 RepID=UPI00235B1480|nr:uncharacterized protein LOC128641196 [Bombina bombina]
MLAVCLLLFLTVYVGFGVTNKNISETFCYPEKVVNGYIINPKDVYREGDSIELQCNQGYTIEEDPDEPRMCTSKGWFPPLKCASVTCDRIHIENGDLSLYFADKLPRLSYFTADFQCHYGYLNSNRVQDGRLFCTKTGWLSIPKCFRSCKIDLLKNAFIWGEIYFPMSGEKVYYKCDAGFVAPDGTDIVEVECLPNGRVTQGRCIKTCDKPALDNGYYQPDKSIFLLGEYLQYQCDEGYRSPKGNMVEISQCLHQGWSITPQCTEFNCSVTEGGRLMSSKYKSKAGEVAHFSCTLGYRLSGAEASQCYYYGWDPPLPTCQKTECTIEISNILTRPNRTRFKQNQYASFSCNKGFKLHGSQRSYCTYLGWYPPLPSCHDENTFKSVHQPHTDFVNESEMPSQCPPAPHPKNSKIKDPKRRYFNGDTVDVICNPGYKCYGLGHIHCEKGKWQASPQCVKLQRCDDLPNIKNGKITEESIQAEYLSDSVVTFKCDPGYHLVGSNESVCIKGHWTPPPICTEKPCGPAPNVQFGSFQGKKSYYWHGDTVQCECDDGYKLDRKEEAKCVSGEWTNVPKCVFTDCESPPSIDNGANKDTRWRYQTGDRVRYQCDYGYAFEGNKDEALCKDRQWKKIPVCKLPELACGKPPEIQNGDLMGEKKQNYSLNSKVKYVCQKNYVLHESDEIICENGVWENLPVCLEPCTLDKSLMAANYLQLHTEDIYKHEDYVEFRCLPGYEVSGKNLVRTHCNRGILKYPECTKIDNYNYILCLNPFIQNIQGTVHNKSIFGIWNQLQQGSCVLSKTIMEENNIFLNGSLVVEDGESVEFECYEGMFPENNLTATCQARNINYPECLKEKKCSSAPQIANGYPKTQQEGSYDTGVSVEYECDQNYELIGSIVVTCMDDHGQTGSLKTTDPILESLEEFFKAMSVLYEDSNTQITAENNLRTLRQGKRPVEDYVAEFQLWVTDSQWNSWDQHLLKNVAMIDSGAYRMFMDKNLVTVNKIPCVLKQNPVLVKVIDGSTYLKGPITHHTIPLLVTTDTGHKEYITFDIIPSSLHPIILGFPWLHKHNPVIDWCKNTYIFNSPYCTSTCYPYVEIKLAQKQIPSEYSDFSDVFNLKKAENLPPHRPYDCPIDTKPVIYLDDILIFSKNFTEHVKHVRWVLTRLREYHLYAKAEKCEFHAKTIKFLGYIITPNEILMDPDKVEAVLKWPTPTTLKSLQRFLGFSNFYRKFIQGFSTIVQPLTKLTGKQKFIWTEAAQDAFDYLKKSFSTAPVLQLPNSDSQFTLEVDASNVGLGAILSQQRKGSQERHPVAYYSRLLTTAERNYSVGDLELLAIKSALDHWRHLLEGTEEPFQVLTDHKNLQYLKRNKTLSSRQVRWSLFFDCFNFQLSYRPGSRNTQADALSRSLTSHNDSEEARPIIPSHKFLATATTFLSDLQSAQDLDTSIPVSFLHNRLIYVPSALCTVLLQHHHDSPLSGHPGITKTHELLSRQYWWPNLKQDIIGYIQNCHVCARNKKAHHKPFGLLNPLPVPDVPWTMIAMDFIVDLPNSNNFTTIMVVVDHLTRLAHFVPLKKIPNAITTAKVFFSERIQTEAHPLQSDGPDMIPLSFLICVAGFVRLSSAQITPTVKKCGPAPSVNYGDIIQLRKETYTTGEEVQYRCPNFYVLQGNSRLKCENGVWSEPPICLEPCTAREQEMRENNVKLKYLTTSKLYSEHGDFVSFTCLPGYEIDDEALLRVQCDRGKLKYPKCVEPVLCTTEMSEMIANNIELKWKPSGTIDVRNGDFVEFNCRPGYEISDYKLLRVKCNLGVMQYPKCLKPVLCTTEMSEMIANNIELKWKPSGTIDVRNGDFVEFNCQPGYEISDYKLLRVKCNLGVMQYPKCLKPVLCTTEMSEMIANNIELKWKPSGTIDVRNGDFVEFNCRPGYEISDYKLLRVPCNLGVMQYPKCLKPGSCILSKVKMEENNIFTNSGTDIENGKTIQFQCIKGVAPVGDLIATCNHKNIDYPKCVAEKKCSAFPKFANGKVISEQEGYGSGSSVKFECNKNFVITGPLQATCTNGLWSDIPQCLGPCTISEDELNQKNIQLRIPSDLTKTHAHGSEVNINCKPRFRRPNLQFLTGECINGNMIFPKCFSGQICRLNQEAVDENFLELHPIHYSEIYYGEGDIVQFVCKDGYYNDDDLSSGCAAGQITYPHCKRKPNCHLNQVKLEENFLELDPSHIRYSIYEDGDNVQFICTQGFYNDTELKGNCFKGEISYPQCKRKDICRLDEEKIEENFLEKEFDVTIYDGDVAYFRCKPGFYSNTELKAICAKTELSYPQCIRNNACYLKQELLDKNNLVLPPHRQHLKYLEDGEQIRFSCKPGYKMRRWFFDLIKTCQKGTIAYPTDVCG